MYRFVLSKYVPFILIPSSLDCGIRFGIGSPMANSTAKFGSILLCEQSRERCKRKIELVSTYIKWSTQNSRTKTTYHKVKHLPEISSCISAVIGTLSSFDVMMEYIYQRRRADRRKISISFAMTTILMIREEISTRASLYTTNI